MAAERRVDPRLAPSSPVHAAQSAPAADADDSVAVVTFSNISGAAEDDWIGRGIAETLTADLEGGGRVLVFGHQAVSTRPRGPLSAGRDARIEATWATEIEAGRLLGSRWIVQWRLPAARRPGASHRARGGGRDRHGHTHGESRRPDARTLRVAGPALSGAETRAAGRGREGHNVGRGSRAHPQRAGERRLRASGTRNRPTQTTASRGRGFVAPATAAIIDGPPPPVAPEIVARDAAGGVTVRAVRLAEPFRLDGRLDENDLRDRAASQWLHPAAAR